MATLEQRAFASLSTRKREQIDNNASPERFMSDVYMNGYKNGATEQQKIDEDMFADFLNSLRSGNIWEGREWKFSRLWREYKEAVSNL